MQKRILVVEDDPTIQALVADVLAEDGYDVELADNGAEALERVRHSRPDGVLLDLMMPVMDGWSFVRACRADPGCARLPIAIMSAIADLDRATSDLDVDTVVAKPFDLDAILDAVARMN